MSRTVTESIGPFLGPQIRKKKARERISTSAATCACGCFSFTPVIRLGKELHTMLLQKRTEEEKVTLEEQI